MSQDDQTPVEIEVTADDGDANASTEAPVVLEPAVKAALVELEALPGVIELENLVNNVPAAKPVKAVKWTSEKARPIVDGALRGYAKTAMAVLVDPSSFLKALESAKTVSQIFGVGNVYLQRVFIVARTKAHLNYARLQKIAPAGYLQMNPKLGKAIEKALAEYPADLPAVSVSDMDAFTNPPSLTPDARKALQLLINDLIEIGGIATCKNDGKYVAFGRNGRPFTTCPDCFQAELVEKKKVLLSPVDVALNTLEQEMADWTKREVERQRFGARKAIDRAFNGEYRRLDSDAAKLWSLHYDDLVVSDVERILSDLESLIVQVRGFVHTNWCKCGEPLYVITPRKGESFMPRACHGCHTTDNTKKAKEVQRNDLPLEDVREAADDAADLGVVVELATDRVDQFNRRKAVADSKRKEREERERGW